MKFSGPAQSAGGQALPPDPVNIPPGCSFRTRCPFAFAPCATVDPELYPRGRGERSACHLMRHDVPANPLFPIDPAALPGRHLAPANP